MGKPSGKTSVPSEVRVSYRLIVLAASLALTAAAAAQNVRFGIRAGVTRASQPDDIENFIYDARNYSLSVEDVRLGFHGGVVLQARLGKIALQPELLVHSTRTDYRLGEIFGTEIIETIRSESFTYLELPVMVGYRWGPVRLQAGPVARAYVASSSELEGVAGYLSDPDRLSFGYQAGIGFDIRKLLIDIKYDGSLNAGSKHLMIGGRDLAFGGGGRTFLTLGLLFN